MSITDDGRKVNEIMTIDASALVMAGGMAIGVVVWLVRLEGRINVTEARYTEIISRLSRIETKQDHSK